MYFASVASVKAVRTQSGVGGDFSDAGKGDEKVRDSVP